MGKNCYQLIFFSLFSDVKHIKIELLDLFKLVLSFLAQIEDFGD